MTAPSTDPLPSPSPAPQPNSNATGGHLMLLIIVGWLSVVGCLVYEVFWGEPGDYGFADEEDEQEKSNSNKDEVSGNV